MQDPSKPIWVNKEKINTVELKAKKTSSKKRDVVWNGLCKVSK